jgi:hypothetical protein
MTDTHTNDAAPSSSELVAPPVEERISNPIHTGQGDEANIRASVGELRKRRERGEGVVFDEPGDRPIIERQYDNRIHGDKKLQETAKDLSDAHAEELPAVQWAAACHGVDPSQVRPLLKDPDWVAGYRPDWTPAEVGHYVRTGEAPPDKIGAFNEKRGLREPLADHESILGRPISDALNVRDAGREVSNFRKAAAAHQAQLLAELTAQEQQQTPAAPDQAVTGQAEPAQQEPPAQQPQADPLQAERLQLQLEREHARLTAAERHAIGEAEKWTVWAKQNFPELQSAEAVNHAAQTNPARFAQLKQAAEKISQNLNGWGQRFMQANQARVQHEQQLHAQANAHVRAVYENFSKQQDELFAKSAPEMADARQRYELVQATKTTLKNAGFREEELAEAWAGYSGVPLRDHRVQQILRKAALYDKMLAGAKNIANNRAPIPPVQKPGTYRPRGADNGADIARLQRELDSATGDKAVRLATRLHQLQRQAS